MVDELRAGGVERRWAPAADGRWVEARRGPDGQELLYLRTVDGACVFLQPDRRCAVHVLFGPDAKPGFCREFPFQFSHGPGGETRAAVRAECAGLHHSSADGPPLTEEQLQDALAVPRVTPRPVFAPEQVQVIGRKVPLAKWLTIEAELIERLDDARSLGPGLALAVLRSVLAEQVDANLPVPKPQKAAETADALFAQVVRALPPKWARTADTVARCRTRAPVGPVDPEIGRYVHLLLRSNLAVRGWATSPGVDIGLGAFALGVAFGLAEARDLPAFDARYRQWLAVAALPVVAANLGRSNQALSDLFVHWS